MVACSIDMSSQRLAESTKSSVSRSSTFFIAPLASWIMLPFLKYGGKAAVAESVDVVEAETG